MDERGAYLSLINIDHSMYKLIIFSQFEMYIELICILLLL